MMSTLFSTFDPATYMKTSLNWLSTFVVLIMMPPTFWSIPTRWKMMLMKMMEAINNEMKIMSGPHTSKSGASLIFISLMILILFNNFMGLFPYIFTSSSHMIFTGSLALPLWLSFMMYGWVNNTTHMLAHLVPQSSPNVLLPFLVCMETTSNLIRPIALTLRLMANMISGHLLLTLMGTMEVSFSMSFITISGQTLMMTLELAVAFIQSYVFVILSILYFKETN